MNNNALQTTTNLCNPSDVNISVNMPQCNYIEMENKTITVSADLKNGAQMQYFSDKKVMRSNL